MRQETLLQSQSSNIDPQTRRQIINKKRMIRKNKIQSAFPDFQDLKSIDTSKLSREEKAKLQKAKNRQAAQRSRDMHKDYVTNLQREIKQLKQELASRKLCIRCQRELEDSTLNDSQSSERNLQDKTKQEHKNPIFQKQQGYHFNQFSSIDESKIVQEEDYFMRTEQNNQDYSYLKMMLLVSMVTIAIFIIVGSSNNGIQSRALMELPKIEGQQIQVIQKLQIDSKTNVNIEKSTQIVPIQNGLIALNNDDCLNSLMRLQTPPSDPKKSLRSYHSNQNNLQSQHYLANQESILLCSVRRPKAYHQDYAKLKSPLVKLYLLGSQIKDMLTSNLLLPIRDSSIQMHGLYRVSAQIKQVSLVTDHNCLL